MKDRSAGGSCEAPSTVAEPPRRGVAQSTDAWNLSLCCRTSCTFSGSAYEDPVSAVSHRSARPQEATFHRNKNQ
jgi:hypothetical protein